MYVHATSIIRKTTSRWYVANMREAEALMSQFSSKLYTFSVTEDVQGNIPVFPERVPDELYWAQEMAKYQLTLS